MASTRVSKCSHEQTVRYGIVDQVRAVVIQGNNTGIGAGSAIGQNTDSIAGAIGGAIIGGLAGNAIENSANKQNGVEIIVKLDNGQIIAVAQGADEQFHIGDCGRVLSGGGITRVSH